MNKLTKENLRLMKDRDGSHRLIIMMPYNTGNYLHSEEKMSVNDAILTRELLLDQEFTNLDVSLKEDVEYYRLILKVKDVNGKEVVFHSRKLNLNDAVFEVDQLTE